MTTLEDISQKLDTLMSLIAAPQSSEIMTRAEAMAYTKRNNRTSFSEWCKVWHVKPYNRGRYSKTQLDRALALEARKRG